MPRILSALVTLFFAAGTHVAANTQANAMLIGDTISASGATLGPPSATIGAGVEFSGLFDGMDFDFGATTLTLTTELSSWNGFGNYVFSDFGPGYIISNMSIISNNGFSGSLPNGFSFTDDSITLNIGSGTNTLRAPATLVYGLEFETVSTPIPEPAAVGLLGTSLIALTLLRRRKTPQAR